MSEHRYTKEARWDDESRLYNKRRECMGVITSIAAQYVRGEICEQRVVEELSLMEAQTGFSYKALYELFASNKNEIEGNRMARMILYK